MSVFPCAYCSEPVLDHHSAVGCDAWQHTECDSVTEARSVDSMPGKSRSVVVLCSTGEVLSQSDSDEDLDLTDTKLFSSDDGNLKEYVEMHDPDNPASLVHKDSPIVLSDEDEAGEVHHSHVDDLPDYESPAEEEIADIKYTPLDKLGKVEPNRDDELPDIYNQDRVDGIDDDIVGYDCYDMEDFHVSPPYTSKVEKFKVARVTPYSTKNRHTLGKGKGKQLVSGPSRCKSSKKKTSLISDSPKNLICSDFGTPLSFEDDSVDIDLHIEKEEQPFILPIPMVCECCAKEEGHNSMVQCCDGHVICTKCVEASAKKALVGEGKGSIECPQMECNSSVPMSELRKALPAIVLDLLEDKWNKETLEALEDMKDVVKCPGCSFSAVLDISLKRFQCIQCKEAYCRYCEYKWNDRKSHDLCVPTKQWMSTVTGNVVNIPAQWSEASEDGTDGKTESHILVKLDTDSAEFLDVVHRMNRHMRVNVKKIYRVENERLWEKYSLTKSHMVADLGELNINEKRLFHGTHRDVIEAICKEGFDWRLCGKHGVAYGQGTYFAKSSMLSHRYSSGYSSSRRGGHAFIGGHLAGTLGQRSPMTILSSLFQPQITPTAFTFGGTLRSTQSSDFNFGVPNTSTSSAPNSSGVGGSVGGCNPVFQFGPTAASSNSGFHTDVQHSGFAHSKSKGAGGCGHNSSISTNLPAPAGFYTKNDTSSDVSSTTDNVLFMPNKSECQNCIFCTHKKKPNARDAGKTGLDPNKFIFSIQKSSPAVQHSGCSRFGSAVFGSGSGSAVSGSGSAVSGSGSAVSGSGSAVSGSASGPAVSVFGSGSAVSVFGSGSAVSGSGSASSGNGNADSTTDEAAIRLKMEKKRYAFLRVISQRNSAHLFRSNVSPSSGFVFQSGGSEGSRSQFKFGPGNSNSNAGGGNGTYGESASSISRLFGVDSGDDDSNDCYMFLARVLLGRSCIGTSNMRRPAKNNEGLETHSAVDHIQKPSIFVIFDNNQCYPEYIIQYSK